MTPLVVSLSSVLAVSATSFIRIRFDWCRVGGARTPGSPLMLLGWTDKQFLKAFA